ncbi:TPA: PH domain-containing protein [Bacillus cereus]|jgi:putative membrane protein|uniref:PH domain-containing protein n=1 Tax=Bacillus cereus group TaxID=86661 RepID=UPI000B599055|nr:MULTISPECIES: PH domain-containing protein [Bacillus cereus group]MDA2411876.1 PH domain-containing protein [Bacillus cereus]NUH89668.1 PH domain-containing protein [Bacillus thuringiensis]NUH95171.1 PH domain-containing protein [Bacillus thuringiensis]NUI00765.1 PH domain-containing protein [Bacillus thuringiensis]NUI05388.1 PH domain-containing protein [Bacillus thuringiensis]
MYKRQHPITMLLELKITDFIPLIIFMFSLNGKFPFWYLIPAAFGLLTVFSAFEKWYYTTYWVENNVLHVKQGLFVKKESYLNKERVQTINTSSNVLYQMLGLKKIQIETAGGGDEAEVSLAGITVEEATELIAMLNESASELKVEKTSEEVEVKEIITEEKQAREYKLTWKEILIASVTSGQFGLLFSLIFFVYHQVDEYIPKWIENSVKSYVMEHDIYGWIFMIAILLVLSWIISTIGYALKHGDFTVNRRNDEVRISQGLLEKKELVLKLHRIQGITIKEGILRQPFGYCAVQVEVIQSKGTDDEKEKVTLHPIIRKDRVQQLLAHLQLPYELNANITSLPKAALRRYLIDSFIFFAMLAIPLTGISIYFEKYYIMWALLPLAILIFTLGYATFKTNGYSVNGEQITLVYRSVGKYTGLIRRRHVQSMEKTQSYFQRRADLCTYKFSSASSSYKIEHTRVEDAERMQDWYKKKLSEK